MFNFKAFYEFFFKSFVVARDIEMIDRLLSEGFHSILLIKRSWLYGAASGLWLVPLFIFGGINAYLILKHFSGSTFGIVLAIFLGLNILGTVYSSMRYIYDYRNSYGKCSKIIHAEDLLADLRKADGSFVRCFNQLQFNFVIFLVIIGVYFVHIFFISASFEIVFAILDVLCIIFQLFVIRQLIHLMIDLEMDFNIAVKGKILFVNQEGMYSDINTLDSEKIKNIRSSYPGFLASFFHYGTLEVLTEGDEALMGHNIMQFVDQPERTVENLNSLLSGHIEIEERIHNAYLQKIIAGLGETPDGGKSEAIKKYLKDYESHIRRDYQETQDPKMKQEIEAIYSEYYK